MPLHKEKKEIEERFAQELKIAREETVGLFGVPAGEQYQLKASTVTASMQINSVSRSNKGVQTDGAAFKEKSLQNTAHTSSSVLQQSDRAVKMVGLGVTDKMEIDVAGPGVFAGCPSHSQRHHTSYNSIRYPSCKDICNARCWLPGTHGSKNMGG